MNLADSVIATLTYSDHFAYPLTKDELHSRLIRTKSSRATLTHTLKQLLHAKKIGNSKGFYYLSGRQNIVASRLQHVRFSAPLISRANSLTRRLARIPGVLAIYLTGSLAVANSSGSDDIDLMIITHPGRLWTTRLLLTLYTTLLGLRRTPHSTHNSGKLCLNLYLTPESFSLPPSRRSLYTAYELIQAVPLYDPHHTHPQLLAANPWIKEHLPDYPFPKILSSPTQENRNTGVLEYLLFHLQLIYMREKITRELITLDSAFFHPRDPSPKVK